ncbi:cysteine proteinase [Tilletiaria anomala UBC 951]|uniref:Cysteine proteinase n=1 Tax=Tilletiaria anomala (strain ATCC 24038 / CBS 436.72 / UBC 951) TaxID=1037660 RepID=A0A066VH86_TILAU|nr:cysteine proteinase [Tilletiaria anomala UBC 951]KDN37920.1 cysteine proteinase [Tilletiaria anomala UBC 951]
MTRSKKSKQLTNGLEDPAQVERDLNAQLKVMGLYAADTVGDGNCLFRALSDQMYGYPELHLEIRQQICDFLAARPDRFAGFVDGSFDQYIKNMRECGTYGGHLELSAFAQLKLKHIKVVQPGLVYVVSGVDESSEMVRAREEKENERRTAQEALLPGSEGPPPSEREKRRLRREAKMKKSASTIKDATIIAGNGDSYGVQTSAEPPNEAVAAADTSSDAGPSTLAAPRAPVEAFGPLYIAYHNWEHYSSIRNLDGPHCGLPRIKERHIDGASLSPDKGKGRANDSEVVSDFDDDDVATDAEALILQSCPGHLLSEVRALLKSHNNDFDSVVEILIAKDAEEEQELDESSPMALKDRSSTGTPALGGAASVSDPVPSQDPPPPTGRAEQLRADHLRDWRAATPSSVDTTVTHSSTEFGSVSTHATTDESGAGTSSDDSRKLRSAKRAASSDAMTASSFRENKRRSNSPHSPRAAIAGGEEAEEGGADRSWLPEERNMFAEVSNDASAIEGIQLASAVAQGKGAHSHEQLSSVLAPALSQADQLRRNGVQTKREKRDDARSRKREREVAKALQRKAQAQGKHSATATATIAGTGTPAISNKAAVEMRGFRELHI